MKFLESVKSSVIMAIKLKDDFTADRKPLGDFYIRMKDIRHKAVMHQTGYCPVLGIQNDVSAIVAGGAFYKESGYTVGIPSITSFLSLGAKPSSPKLPLLELFLWPNENHPVRPLKADVNAIIKGRIIDSLSNGPCRRFD